MCIRNVSKCGLDGVMNHIDDACICGKTEEEHDRNLNAVLQRIQDKGLTLNPDKCVFKQTEFVFFGMKFSKALKEAKLQ